MTGTCLLCNRHGILERHHIYSGSYRQIADKLGLVIDICPECHRFLHSGAGAQTKREMQRSFQRAYMNELGITVEEWLNVFGKSWL